MRPALLSIALLVACGGSAPPPTHAVATETIVPASAPPTTTAADQPKPEPKPDTVASADPCEGGQVDDTSLRNVGTRGGGIGTGSVGGGRPATPARNAPTVHEETVTVSGGIDRDILRRVVRSHMSELRYCYEKELQKDPTLKGRVVIKFVIAKDGTVASASAEGINPAIAACVAARVQKWKFPNPDGYVVNIVYPIVFDPGAD